MNTPLFDQAWKRRHADALAHPTPGSNEEKVVNLLGEMERLSYLYHGLAVQFSDDYVLRQAPEHVRVAVAALGTAVRTLLNADVGRLDASSIDTIAMELVSKVGGDPDDF